MSAHVAMINNSLTIGEFDLFQGIEVENENMNYWVIVGNEEDDNTLMILIINKISRNS